MREKRVDFKKKKNVIVVVLQIIFLTTLIISGIEITKWVVDNKKNDNIIKSISKSVTIIENKEKPDEKYKINFNDLKNVNDDTVGWIKVNNTNIEFPIVKTDNNDFYLTHNFEKDYNKAGWIFIDYRNKLDGTDKNIIIYGHNMRNGSMFGSLLNTLKKEWQDNEENNYITLVTENEYLKYEVFSVYQIETEDTYIKTSFNENEFETFANEMKKRSIKKYDVQINEDDEMLTLSTCGNNKNYRVVLHAKKVKQ